MDFLPLFSSPVMVLRIDGTEALGDSLTARLVDESLAQEGLQRSNVGGWHSQPDLSTRSTPVVREFVEMLIDGAHAGLAEMARRCGSTPLHEPRLGIQAWAMVMREGDYTVPHDHAESHLSGVYYLDAGDADLEKTPDSGLLAFQDPRGGVPHVPGLELYPSTFTVQPQTGVLGLFPGFLTHYVHPYRGKRPRVSVSFNVRVEPRRLRPPRPLRPFGAA